MAYTPTNWQNGDTITAEKLNNMESANVPFVVTLTPTALDYSGEMDMTVAEIYAAYEAGKRIVFRILMGASEYMDVDCTARYAPGSTYPSFNAFIVTTQSSGMIILAMTGVTDDGAQDSYSTKIFPLTPMS